MFFGVAALIPLVVRDAFFLDSLVLILLWGALSAAWNVAGGYAGQVSIGHAAFFGIGAYSAALMVRALRQQSPWLGMLVGVALSLVAGARHRLPLEPAAGPVLRALDHRVLAGAAHRGQPLARASPPARRAFRSRSARASPPSDSATWRGSTWRSWWRSSTTASRSSSSTRASAIGWPACARTRTRPRRSALPARRLKVIAVDGQRGADLGVRHAVGPVRRLRRPLLRLLGRPLGPLRAQHHHRRHRAPRSAPSSARSSSRRWRRICAPRFSA